MECTGLSEVPGLKERTRDSSETSLLSLEQQLLEQQHSNDQGFSMPPSQTVQDHFESQQNFKAITLSTGKKAGYLFPRACTTPDF